MGGCFSVSLPCDQTVNQCSQWLCLKGSYIHNLSENLVALDKAISVLQAKRDDVQRRVNREEFTGHRRRLAQVQVWLTSILTIENKFIDLFSTSTLELQRLCLCGICSKSLKSSYSYGKRVSLMLREVESISSQGEFDAVTEEAPRASVEELSIQPIIIGQETMLESAWKRLMEDKVGIVGLYGMGGVGKTTLLMQINNKFSEIRGSFHVVIWIVVSNNATVRKIQGDIAKKIGLMGKEWDEKAENERARDIYNVLRRKKFVLMLDDIWEKVNLRTVGVPYPNRENGCKVAFTTRSRDVCGRMGVDFPIQVRCLDSDTAWDLFKKKVGENTLGSHPNISDLGKKVAEKCRGLPLALNVIGETMASKTTVQEWRRAVDVLTSSAIEFSGMEDEILPILKYSYDNLNGEHVKLCFLYCAMFPEDYLIDKERLIEYWISEGFINEKESRERAFNQGYEIIDTLIRACLLLEGGEDKSKVNMHDVVREMALWIASELGKHKERCIVQAGVGLHEIPKVKNWENVRRMSLMENKIKNISDSPNCPELTTFLLGSNYRLVTMRGEFFRSMPSLLVLDLSGNLSLTGLPEEISGLVSLRYLDLSSTPIKRLPIGLQELKMLIHLNLESTGALESLDGISKLSSLRTLKLLKCKVRLDMRLVKELQLFEHLEFISISISSSLVEKLLLYDPRIVRIIQHLFIRGQGEESVRVLILAAMDNFYQVYIEDCGISEIKIEKTPWQKSLSSPCFLNLSHVELFACEGLKDLTWLLFAPNLTHLTLTYLKQVEEIINKEKAGSNIIPFQKLEFLWLFDLPELKSIYWNALPFQRLGLLNICACDELRKLPLDSKSVFKVEELVIEYDDEEWMREIIWEDEATENRFLPFFKFCNDLYEYDD